MKSFAILPILLMAAPLAVAAHPGAMPVGGVHATGNLPIAQPQHPVTANNPNGNPPVGKPVSPGSDTDRGRSEGKGHNDTMHGKNVVVGTVVSLNGTLLTLRLPNGTTKTFTVNPRAFGQRTPQPGQQIAIRTNDGMRADSFADANQTIRGTIVAANTSMLTLKLPNGRTQTIWVAPSAATRINLTPGMPVTITTHDGGASAASIIVVRP